MREASYSIVFMVRQGLEQLPAYTMEQTALKYGMMVQLDQVLQEDKPENGGGEDGNKDRT